MFKVECPGCKAPYQVDERRIPPSGLKMRCPKCGTSFKVDAPDDAQRTGPSPVLGAVFGMGADTVPPPPEAPKRPVDLKRTMAGVAPEALSALRSRDAAGARAPAPPQPADLELDLPSPAPEVGLPAPAGARPAPPKRAAPRAAPPSAPRAAPPSAPRAQPVPPRQAPPPRPVPVAPAPVAAAPPPPPPHRRTEPSLPSIGTTPLADSIDLPAPAPPRRPEPSGFELDLPSVSESSEPPPLRSPSRSFGEIELDLPTARSNAQRRSRPVERPPSELPSAFPLDLPAVHNAREDAGIDLPDLMDPALPSPASLDLPDLAAGLPSPGGAALPAPAVASLPSRSTAALPLVAPGLPSPRADAREVARGQTSARAPHDGFGELDLPLITPQVESPAAFTAESLEADPFAVGSLPPVRSAQPSVPAELRGPETAPPAAVVRQQGGGTSYGEVDLGGDASEMPLEAPPARPPQRSEDDMEFGAIPQESEARAAAPVPALPREVSNRVPKPAAPPSVVPQRSRRGRLLPIFVPAFVLLVGGASLALVPDLGPFGAYWILDRVRAGEYERLLQDTVARAKPHLQSDSFSRAKAALADVEAVRAGKQRVHSLTAYAAFLGFSRELRFGADPEAHARAQVLLEGIADKEDVRFHELARAAQAAADGQLARARQVLQGPLRRAPRDPDALALKGEVELRARDAKAAVAAWAELVKVENSARAAFGLARARFAGRDFAGAVRDAEQALAKNPGHLGARILTATIASASREGEPRAIAWLEAIAKDPKDASAQELVQTHTLLGDIHLGRSRISRSEAAYAQALKIDPKAARALIGLGEALYRAGRYSEAQARFEAGSQAEPDDVLAKIGVAKSTLMLERLEEAQASLKKLKETHPGSMAAAYWYGRALEATGNREQAERVYRETIAKEPVEPVLVDAYIALALLHNQHGRPDQAKATLQAARQRLPRSSAIHRAMGDFALTHGRYGEAEEELRRAIELDPEDLGARFKLGVALRRAGKFDEAARVFEEVKAVDRDYPGLALEHGLLFEASGRTEEALKAYEGALVKAPDDPDLMLRVGCGYATAGRTKEAQTLLRKVLALRPTSPETNHCLGRALLAEGSRLADALRQLDRAVELDPHRAEYHLYVGWAANEAGNVPKAERALEQAIKLDQGLADAYWQRGVLRARQGAVREAVQDLTRALTLRPTRHEAHAALADAYYDLGKETLALAEWRKAVAAQPDNATWRFRYGKLLAANQMNEQARAELALALELADKSVEAERWIWEAHHLMGRALGSRPEAAQHWEQFLRLGPLDSPYRSEAKAALQKLGKTWTGN